jgi:uridylate kinase
MPAEPRFRRVLLKVSGEALAGSQGFGLDPEVLDYMGSEVKKVHDLGAQIAMVVGGGNLIRGAAFSRQGSIERTVADQMGMLATIMNGLALQAAIEAKGVPCRVQSAITMSEVCEPFIRRRAIRHMEKGRVVVFAAGTGNPYFTTDTASVLRGLEIEADALIKATKVDGIYDKDPNKHDDAVRYDNLTFTQAIEQNLAVMDQTAFTMCREHSLPIIVLDLHQPGAMAQAVLGEAIGTRVEGS